MTGLKMAYENWLTLFDLEKAEARLSQDGNIVYIIYDKWKNPYDQQQGEIRILKKDILFTELRQTPSRSNIIVRTRSADGKQRNYNLVFKKSDFNYKYQYEANQLYNELFGFVHC